MILVLVFVVGYILIAFEHQVKLDKAATALLTGVIGWLVLRFTFPSLPSYPEVIHLHPDTGAFLQTALAEHLGSIAEILFFLLGAMTIVELIDVHGGFRPIADRIEVSNPVRLLWIMSWITFFLSAVLDNMTTAIVMCAILRRIVDAPALRWWYGGFVIIAANAGGAWSPIGDVTTIMLWIGGQVTSVNIITSTFLASAFCLLVPLGIASFFVPAAIGHGPSDDPVEHGPDHDLHPAERNLILIVGSASLISVPVFKAVTHLPPYMGILFALGLLWFLTAILHRDKDPHVQQSLSVAYILRRIDTPTLLFFLGILLAVGSIEVSGHLDMLAEWLNHSLGNIYAINTGIGILSAIVDNVPLVAASMGMYDLQAFPPDHAFWELLAYCAGTGGSMLIIGSAAGVAAMGILKINFIWYLKRMTLYAAIGYGSGILVYGLQSQLLH